MPGLGVVGRGGSGGSLDRREQRPHLVALAGLDAAQGHGEEDDEGEADPRLHLLEAADGVLFKPEHAVEPAVDPLDRGAPVVRAGPSPSRSRSEAASSWRQGNRDAWGSMAIGGLLR